MKSFKDMLETVAAIRSPDERNFADKHVVDKMGHPVANDTQFVAKTKQKKRRADYEDSEAVYEQRMIECPDCDESYAKGEEHVCDMEVSEADMSSDKMNKREEIVKSMKNKMGDFKEKYGDKAKMAMKEDADLSEAVIDDLRDIVKSKSMKRIKLDDGTQTRVDLFTASALVQVYDKLSDANKQKFASGMAKNENMFMKMVDFAFSGGKS
jgi:hypothetical protein